jgi:hypothetical protein
MQPRDGCTLSKAHQQPAAGPQIDGDSCGIARESQSDSPTSEVPRATPPFGGRGSQNLIKTAMAQLQLSARAWENALRSP